MLLRQLAACLPAQQPEGACHVRLIWPIQSNLPAPCCTLLQPAGFDSSCLEFRRFHPLLSQLGDVYAVDLAGWGELVWGLQGCEALLLLRVPHSSQSTARLAPQLPDCLPCNAAPRP